MFDNDRLHVQEDTSVQLGWPIEAFLMVVSFIFFPAIAIADHFLFGVLRACWDIGEILLRGSSEQTKAALLLMALIFFVGMGLLVFKVYALPICISRLRSLTIASVRITVVRWGYSLGTIMIGALGFAGFVGIVLLAIFYQYYPDAAVSIFTNTTP